MAGAKGRRAREERNKTRMLPVTVLGGTKETIPAGQSSPRASASRPTRPTSPGHIARSTLASVSF